MTSVNHPSLQDCHELWTVLATRQPFTELEQRYRLTEFAHLLQANTLNILKNRLSEQRDATTQLVNTFQCQDSIPETDLYYETIIYRNNVIPTRRYSWHDLFNGLIWLNFPKTKTLLNKWHVEDIENHGLTPRTPRRNQITLFDECGVVLAVTEQQLCEDLRQHNWHSVFVKNRQLWRGAELNASALKHTQKIKPFIFGHANYEMLIDPFLGLTGKWLAVLVDDKFFKLTYAAQLATLDSAIYDRISATNNLSESGKLPPLPLLGIPGWCAENQDERFYLNQDYFRPKRQNKK